MTGKNDTLDATMMYAVHDALRRELEHLARITARPDDDPRHILTAAVGWEMFKGYLRVHHTSEDDALWPAMQRALADRPDDLALLDALEAEHAEVDPLLAAVDTALADRESGPDRLGGLVDALRAGVTGHLRHEETDGLALIGATLSEQQWRHFGAVHRDRIGADARRYLPWVLEDASPERVAAILGGLPEPVRAAYRDDWQPAYAATERWPADAVR